MCLCRSDRRLRGDRYAFWCRLERFVRHAAEEEVSDPTNAGAVKWRNINGRVSDMVNYAAGLQGDHIMRLFLHSGIENFYLTVRFRPTPGGKVKRGESLVKAIEA
jgi:hypothetical protein